MKLSQNKRVEVENIDLNKNWVFSPNFFILQNKKGITPLNATILLVVISILLGTVVMSIMEKQFPEINFSNTGEQEVKKTCDLVDVKITKFQDQELICLRENYLDIILENNANIDVDDFQTTIIGEKETQNFNSLKLALSQETSGRIKIPYDQKIGKIIKIKITPKIENNKITCTQKTIEKENIKNC